MKKCLAVLAISCLCGGVAYGANPFSDVESNSWAYQAVSQLSEAGIINGYPDGTFKGEKDITRFEMAQMVAKALANQDRANADQQALINRLADEFTVELQNLGVRIARLENNVGNVKVTGNFRLRYRGGEFKNGAYPYGGHSKFDYRARVIMTAKVNDKTEATVRLQGSSELGNSKSGSMDGRINLAYVDHKLNPHTTLRIGRQLYTPGLGLMYDDLVDGVRLMYNDGKWDASLSYSYWWGGTAHGQSRENTITAVMAEAKRKVNSHITLGAMYGRFQSGELFRGTELNGAGGTKQAVLESPYKHIWGLNGTVRYGRWDGFGEWLKAPGVSNSDGWMTSVGYGTFNLKKANTYSVRLEYYNEQKNSPILSSAFAPAYGYYNSHYVHDNTQYVRNGFKGFVANLNYVPQPNVSIGAYYGFNNKDQEGVKLADYWRTDVNYRF